MRFKRKLIKAVGLLTAVCLIPINSFAAMREWHEEAKPSKLVYYDKDGNISYSPYTEKGDILPDYSHVGYKNGDIPIPEVPVKLTVEADRLSEDDTERIQAAIDAVSRLEADSNGIRGAVLLKKGKYTITSPLTINTSGVVLRGEGMQEDGTVIFAKGTTRQYTAVSIVGGGTVTELEETKTAVTDEYIPVGTYDVTVEDTSCYGVGDEIVFRISKNQHWIDYMGMGAGGVLDGKAGKNIWKASDYVINAERRITAINGNVITMDAPLVDSADTEFGDCEIVKVIRVGRISNCGIEDICFESDYNGESMQIRKPMWNVYTDQTHALWATNIKNAENCWLRGVTSRYFVHGVTEIGSTVRSCTVEGCEAIDPVAPLLGGYRYGFSVSGQQNLIKDCYTRNQRHDYVMGKAVPGPNVFYNCLGENAYATSETHQRWTCGVLYDNVTVTGPAGSLSCINRGTLGSGQGWTGGQVMFWNCLSAVVSASKPPTGQNFVIGVKGPLNESDPVNSEVIQSWREEGTSGDVDTKAYEGIMAVGDAYFENTKNPAYPQSLYLMQYDERQKGAWSKLTDAVALAENCASALIDKKKVSVDAANPQGKTVVRGETILVPVRFLTAAFGSDEPVYNEKTRSVRITHDDTAMVFTAGMNEMLVNGKKVTLSAAAELINNRMYVPADAYGEAIGKFIQKNGGLLLIQSYPRQMSDENAVWIANTIKAENTTSLPVLTSLKVNGAEIKGFSPYKTSYTLSLPFSEIANMKVEADSAYQVKIHDMDMSRKSVTIEVSDGTHRNFYIVEAKGVVPENLQQIEIASATSDPAELSAPANVIDLSIDGDPVSAWVTSGSGKQGVYELAEESVLEAVGIIFKSGDSRQAYFTIETSSDGTNWTLFLDGISSGSTTECETFVGSPVKCKYIRFTGNKNSSNDYNNVCEFYAYSK